MQQQQQQRRDDSGELDLSDLADVVLEFGDSVLDVAFEAAAGALELAVEGLFSLLDGF